MSCKQPALGSCYHECACWNRGSLVLLLPAYGPAYPRARLTPTCRALHGAGVFWLSYTHWIKAQSDRPCSTDRRGLSLPHNRGAKPCSVPACATQHLHAAAPLSNTLRDAATDPLWRCCSCPHPPAPGPAFSPSHSPAWPFLEAG